MKEIVITLTGGKTAILSCPIDISISDVEKIRHVVKLLSPKYRHERAKYNTITHVVVCPECGEQLN